MSESRFDQRVLSSDALTALGALTRRRALLAVAGVGATAALAACGGGSDPDSAQPADDSGAGTGAGDSNGGGSNAQSGGSGDGGSPDASHGASASGQGQDGDAKPLAKLADIPVGGAVSAKDAEGEPVLVSRPTADTAAAFSAICTHMGCTVQPAGKELHCPCHGSRYAVATGKVLGGPAPRPLPKIPVQVEDGEVVQAG